VDVVGDDEGVDGHAVGGWGFADDAEEEVVEAR
jgi:hypothetical protein